VETQTAAKVQPSGRFEVYAWFFMRVSGILLILMVLVHFGIMHLYYGVDKIDFSTVAFRYRTPFWRIYDMLLISLAVSHGVNGTKMILDDYIHPRGWRIAAVSAAMVIGAIFLGVGIFNIISFHGG
jgi:succinate dehydrogenase / fumarate reductase, membrane anchor subunit